MKENNLDKCIRVNFKMVDNEIAAASCMSLFVVFCIMTLWLLVLAIVPLIVTFVYLFKMYKKLFYTSVYGETAVTYQSMPASAAEMTAAKIFVAGIGNIICVVTYIVVIAAFLFFLGGSSLSGLIANIQKIVTDLSADGGIAAYTLVLAMVALIASTFMQSALIFLAVVAYQSVVREEKKGLYRFLIITGAYVINQLLGRSGTLLEKLGIDSLIIPAVIGIVLSIVVMVLCYRKTVKLLEEKYEWG